MIATSVANIITITRTPIIVTGFMTRHTLSVLEIMCLVGTPFNTNIVEPSVFTLSAISRARANTVLAQRVTMFANFVRAAVESVGKVASFDTFAGQFPFQALETHLLTWTPTSQSGVAGLMANLAGIFAIRRIGDDNGSALARHPLEGNVVDEAELGVHLDEQVAERHLLQTDQRQRLQVSVRGDAQRDVAHAAVRLATLDFAQVPQEAQRRQPRRVFALDEKVVRDDLHVGQLFQVRLGQSTDSDELSSC